MSGQTMTLTLPSGNAVSFLVGDPGSPAWEELRELVAENARLREVEREAEASKTDPISWCNLKKRSGEMREEVTRLVEENERILQLLAVIEAAKALRDSRRASPRTKFEIAFDAALAALEGDK